VFLHSRSEEEEQPLILTADTLLHSGQECTGCEVPNSALCGTVSVLAKAYVAEQRALLHFRSTRVAVYVEALCGGTGGTVQCADRASVR
jgi:hypothetical protein